MDGWIKQLVVCTDVRTEDAREREMKSINLFFFKIYFTNLFAQICAFFNTALELELKAGGDIEKAFFTGCARIPYRHVRASSRIFFSYPCPLVDLTEAKEDP